MNETLRNAIKSYGQSNLARDAGMSKSTVSLVANGKRSFSKAKGKTVSKLLNIPLAVALGID